MEARPGSPATSCDLPDLGQRWLSVQRPLPCPCRNWGLRLPISEPRGQGWWSSQVPLPHPGRCPWSTSAEAPCAAPQAPRHGLAQPRAQKKAHPHHPQGSRARTLLVGVSCRFPKRRLVFLGQNLPRSPLPSESRASTAGQRRPSSDVGCQDLSGSAWGIL